MYVTLMGKCHIDGQARGYGKLQIQDAAIGHVNLTFRGQVDPDMPEVVFSITIVAGELKKAVKII